MCGEKVKKLIRIFGRNSYEKVWKLYNAADARLGCEPPRRLPCNLYCVGGDV